VPLILRHVDQAKAVGTFRFVGEFYVRGIMDGESFVEARKLDDKTYDGDDIAWP